MILAAAVGVMLASWALCWAVSTLLNVNLYWPMAAGWAAWTAYVSKKDDLKRFERTFPLDPLGSFLAVCLVWPFAFPWFLRLRFKASRGLLTPPARPSRGKYVLLGVAALVPLLLIGSAGLVRRSPLFAPVLAAQAALAQEPQVAHLNLNSGLLTLTITNSSISVKDGPARTSEARRIAALAAQAVDTFSAVTTVAVAYTKVSGTAGITMNRTESTFTWPKAELLAASP